MLGTSVILNFTILVSKTCVFRVQVVEDTAEDDILYRQLVIECKGHDKAVLKSYETFVSAAAQHLEVNITDM